MKKKIVSSILLTLFLMSTLALAVDAELSGARSIPRLDQTTVTDGGHLALELQNTEFPSNMPFIYVDPPFTNVTVGSEFTISVKIFNLTDTVVTQIDEFGRPQAYPLGNLYGFEFRLTWDSAVIDYKAGSRRIFVPVETYPSGVLHTPTMQVYDIVDSAAGTYDIAYASQSPAEPFNNHGQSNTIFNMTFRVKRDGGSALQLVGKPPSTYVKLAASPDEPYPSIPHEKSDGLVVTPGAPIADFVSWPSDGYAAVNEVVMFDASASYDSDSSPSIVLYMWDFGDGMKQNSTGSIMNHTFTSVGVKRVRLRVIDDEGAVSAAREKSIAVVGRRDIALKDIHLSSSYLARGDTLGIVVSTKNIGASEENFKVSAYYNVTSVDVTGTEWVLIGTWDANLKAFQEGVSTFYWNTSILPERDAAIYISANLTSVPHESNFSDNTWDPIRNPRFVKVIAEAFHNIATADLNAQVDTPGSQFESPFIKGEEVTIRFRIEAKGSADEKFNATLDIVAQNGTVLQSQSWVNQSLQKYTWRDYEFKTASFAEGNHRITVNATIAELDFVPEDNFREKQVRVILPPILNVEMPPRIYANVNTTFNATASHHQDPEGRITKYVWEFVQLATMYRAIKYDSLVNYTFYQAGYWLVQLTITDNFGVTYLIERPATSSYRAQLYINVENIRLSISVEPQKGPVGTEVRVIGVNATPNGTVEIYWGKPVGSDYYWRIEYTYIGKSVADAGGYFSFKFNVPAFSKGACYVRAIDGTTRQHAEARFTVTPKIAIEPSSGPVGTKVAIKGSGLPQQTYSGLLTFDDQLLGFIMVSSDEDFNATFSVPVSSPGLHIVKVVFSSYYGTSTAETTFVVIDETQLDINAEVGSVHFRGETAELFVQTAFKGVPTNATQIEVTLHKPEGTTEHLLTQQIATGLYKYVYSIPSDASTGTYVLVVEANYRTEIIDSKGTSIKSFLLSTTLTAWNPWLIEIKDDVAIVRTDLGNFQISLDAINACIAAAENNLVKIDTNIGLIWTDIDTINARISSIDGKLATITTDIGTVRGMITSIENDVAEVKTDIGNIKAVLQGWTGGTTSLIVTPRGTFQMLILTTSEMIGSAEFIDDVLTITVNGESGTEGTTRLIIPKQLLSSLESSIDKVAVTIDGQLAAVAHEDHLDTDVLTILYTHSMHTIRAYLTGVPPATFPLTLYLVAIVVLFLAVGGSLFFIRRKARTAKIA